MNEHDPDRINRLIGKFSDLQEQWEEDPDAFDWAELQALARDGAQAYNEGAGPSFHALALDGVEHGEFHERFLAYSVESEFDPFKLSRAGNAAAEIPVVDHADLMESASYNPSSARMRASLMELARARFESIAKEAQGGSADAAAALRIVEACAESIPNDILEKFAPELVRSHEGEEVKDKTVDPVEGYLSSAEAIVDRNTLPYG